MEGGSQNKSPMNTENPFGAHASDKAFGSFESRRAATQRQQFAHAIHPSVRPGAENLTARASIRFNAPPAVRF